MATVEFGMSQSRAGKRAPRRILIAAALTAIGACTSACSMIDQFNPFGTEKYKMEIVPDTPASKTYNQGLEKLANGSPSEAAKKFTDLGKQYPGSDWARKALLMTIYANYQAGNYTDAETSADRFLKEYATSPDAAYVTYLRANAYYMQIPDISRDQDDATKAMQAFQDVVKKYPTSEYVEDAKFKIQVTEDQLAGKEMSIGRFYLNRHNYTAAINRFRNVLQYYQTTRQAEEALYRLVEAYLGLGITDEAQTAAAVLGHNFPDSQWYQDAYALLKGKGLSPEEHSSSWISKIYHVVVPS
ncbi:MAG TPA: outer membrane protein assembly factor BamD [Roseiarcus sp.]|jgi:outer membrane protein assembly factor BamD|nr:outer membrane protein assembly factor BamD [Roseiarcus sp.]